MYAAYAGKNDTKKQPLMEEGEEPGTKRDSRVSFHKLETLDIEDGSTGKMNLLARFEAMLGNNIAFYYMIFSAFMMSLHALCAKLTSAIPPFEILFIRSIFLIIILYIYIKYSSETISINDQRTRKSKKMIILISVLSLILGWCYLYGISKMPLSEAVVLIYASPMYTGFLAFVLAKEMFSRSEIAAASGSLIGIVFILRPDFIFGDEHSPHDKYNHATRAIGGGVCIINSILLSLQGIVTKMTGTSAHAVTLLLLASVITFVCSPILWLVFEDQVFPNIKDLGMIMMMACFNFVGQFFLIKSYQHTEKTLIVSLVNYIQIIFAYLFDFVFLKDVPEVTSVVGTFFIMCCCIYLVYLSKKN